MADEPDEAKPGSSLHEEDETGRGKQNENEDYAVGYKKPPKHTQFKTGNRANPKGRENKEPVEDIRIIMEDVLAETVKVREGGKVRSVSQEEAIMRAELVNALNGDLKSIEALFKRCQKCGLFSKAAHKSLMILTEPVGDDGKIVRMFAADKEALRKAADDYDASLGKSKPDGAVTKERKVHG